MAVIKLNVEEFVTEIRRLVKNSDTTYMDALVYYAETNDIEIETVADIVKKIPTIQVGLLEEAEEMNLVEKSAKLPT
jgi:hypothetical protein